MKAQEQANLAIAVAQIQSIKGVRKMFKNIAKLGSVVFVVGLLSACAGSTSYHQYLMSGQVVDVVDKNEVVLCIGTEDSAETGQKLAVYRVTSENYQEGMPTYRRERAGEITIDSIIDKHFARASVNSGDVKLHDIVELEK